MTDGLPPLELERLRRRTLRSLVAGVALGSTGHIAAATVATIVAQDIAGSTAWSGAPGATVVLGAAAGAVVLAQLMVRFGRRNGLAAGYGFGVAGAFVATASVVLGLAPAPARRDVPDRLRQRVQPAVPLRGGRPVPAGTTRLRAGHGRLGRHDRSGRSGPTSRRRRRTWPAPSGCPISPAPTSSRSSSWGWRCCSRSWHSVPTPTRSPTCRRVRDRAEGERRHGTRLAERPSPAERARCDGRARDGHGRDGPDHDDDAAAHGPARSRHRRGRAGPQRAHVRDVRPVTDLRDG